MTYERALARIRKLVRERRFVVSFHAAEELEEDGLSVLDVENIILGGEIVHRQVDRKTREKKYVLRGHCLTGEAAGLVAKLGFTGRVVVITVYLGNEVKHDV